MQVQMMLNIAQLYLVKKAMLRSHQITFFAISRHFHTTRIVCVFRQIILTAFANSDWRWYWEMMWEFSKAVSCCQGPFDGTWPTAYEKLSHLLHCPFLIYIYIYNETNMRNQLEILTETIIFNKNLY